MSRSRVPLALPLAALSLLALAAGCSSSGGPGDGGNDARADGAGLDAPATADTIEEGGCRADLECDNGVFCDGVERCLGGRCSAGAPACDDRRSCTQDSCDEAMRACTRTPDDSMCGDMNACNGVETCSPDAPGANAATGCTPVRPDNVVDCDDANNCTIDACDTVAGCVHAPRDLDGDGHVDRGCTLDGTRGGPLGDDCNDGDPAVYPAAVEICDDRRDNNCDGTTDYFDPICVPSNDTCASATVLPGPGIYYGATRGLTSDYSLSCNPGSYADAVFEFTTTEVQDVSISISTARSDAAVALVGDCSPTFSEQRCGRGGFSSNPTLRVRSLPAGTYRIVAETGATTEAFRLTLRYDSATTTPVEDLCPATEPDPAVELNDGMPHTAMLGMLEDDYILSCNTFDTMQRDAVFRLTLPAASDVVLTATPAGGTFSTTYVSFRNAPCVAAASERSCRSGFDTTGVRVNQRSLPAGTYWVIVENSSNNSVTVQATITSPPTPTVTYTSSTPTGVSFIDACALPGATTILALRDDATDVVPASAIPFPLRVYGIAVTGPFTVSSNGYMGFGSPSSWPLSGTIGDPSEPNLILALNWADLYTRSTGICYASTGTAPNRQFIIEWNDLHYCCTDDAAIHMTFEAIYNEAPAGTSNTIDVIYQRMDGATRTPGAGIENEDGSVFTTIPGPFTAPRVVRLTPM